ncbi:MAG: orotidine-5'-phosphate decarboxylase [Fibrobacteres bacterium]|nr:orotidine-5'-phosphate decarboxylase [Fibrobacterota bacterium]
MFVEKLKNSARKNRSLVCVGLDFDPEKAGETFRKDPLGFNRMVIDATIDIVCCYKPNSAFYEVLGRKGIEALEKTIEYIDGRVPVILDAKRGDIGNTSSAYAKAAFEILGADAVTIAPYMGFDSVLPFLEYPDRGVFVLCLTSNPGSADFQRFESNGHPLFIHVAKKCNEWAQDKNPNIGLVVGATQADMASVRAVTSLPFLVPGVGAQGGDLKAAITAGYANGFAVINSSRNIIFPAGTGDAAPRVRAAALSLREEILTILQSGGLYL